MTEGHDRDSSLERGNRAERANVWVTGVAVAASLAALVVSAVSCGISRNAEARAMAQYETEYAVKVAIDEVPFDSIPMEESPDPSVVRWAVVNANSGRVGEIWVRTRDGAIFNIEAIPRCTMYMFPVGPNRSGNGADRPDVVHFRDVHGLWKRGLDSPPQRVDLPSQEPESMPRPSPYGALRPIPVDQCN